MNNMVLLAVTAESSFWIKHLFDILTIGIGLLFTIALYVWASSTKSHQLRMYIPTVWTSLGILFTFISIYTGLTNEDLLKNVSDGHIESLINRIIPAFSTSIIGIIGAIICSIINKGLLASIEDDGMATFNKLRRQLIENEQLCFGYDHSADSPELLLFEMISAVYQKGKSIENILRANQTSTTRKSDEIFGRFDELLTKLNGSSNGVLIEAFDTQNGKFQENYNVMSDLLKELNSITNTAITTALDLQRKDFESSMRDLKSSFNETLLQQNNILENKLNKLQDTNTGLIRDLINITRDKLAEESEKRNDELHGFIEQENGEIKNFIATQTELYQGIKANLSDTVSDIRQLFEDDIKQLSEDTIIQCNNDLVEKSKEYLEKHMQSVNGYIIDLKAQIDKTRNAFEDSIGALPDAMSQKLDELHGKESELIKTTIIDNRTSIDNLLGENKKAVKTAIADLGSNLQSSFDEIKDVIATSIQTNKDNLDKLLKDYKGSISAVLTEIKIDNETIKSELMAAQKGWKDAAEDMERKHQNEVIKINEKAQQDILKISNAIIEIERSLQQSLNKIAGEVTNSISVFNSKQESIKSDTVKRDEELLNDIRTQIIDSFRTLQSSTGEIVGSIKGTLDKFKSETEKITGSLSTVERSIKESSDKYAETIRNYDEKIDYIGDVINLFKAHVTNMAALEIEVNKFGETLKQTQELANSTAPKKENPKKKLSK